MGSETRRAYGWGRVLVSPAIHAWQFSIIGLGVKLYFRPVTSPPSGKKGKPVPARPPTSVVLLVG